MKLIAVCLMLLTLVSCSTATPQALDAKCRSYGAVPGTPAYVNCRAQLDAAAATICADKLFCSP
jgi:hypothetical protein